MIQKSITTTPFDIAYHGISVVSMGSSWVVLRSPQIAGGGVSQSIDALVEILDQHLQTWSTDELLTGKIGCSANGIQWWSSRGMAAMGIRLEMMVTSHKDP